MCFVNLKLFFKMLKDNNPDDVKMLACCIMGNLASSNSANIEHFCFGSPKVFIVPLQNCLAYHTDCVVLHGETRDHIYKSKCFLKMTAPFVLKNTQNDLCNPRTLVRE